MTFDVSVGSVRWEALGVSLYDAVQLTRSLASEGYQPRIHNRLSSYVQVARVPDGYVLTWVPSGADLEENAIGSREPTWVELVRQWLSREPSSSTDQGEQQR